MTHKYCSFELLWWISRVLCRQLFPPSFISKTSGICFSVYLWNRLSLFMFWKTGLPSPSPVHQLTERLHFLKFREGFFSQHLYLPHRPLTAQEERVLNTLPGFERCLNSSCQSGACILCFRIFPGGFDVNPFHTSNTSVLLQAFLSFLNIQIYIYIYAGKETWAVIVHFLKGDFNDETLASPRSYSILITGDSGSNPWSFNI